MDNVIVRAKKKWKTLSLWTKRHQHLLMKVSLFLLGCYLGAIALDASAKDLLSGTDVSLTQTLKGTGKKYIYLIEILMAIAAYIKTKNILTLFGVVVVAVFLNIGFHIAGVQS